MILDLVILGGFFLLAFLIVLLTRKRPEQDRVFDESRWP